MLGNRVSVHVPKSCFYYNTVVNSSTGTIIRHSKRYVGIRFSDDDKLRNLLNILGLPSTLLEYTGRNPDPYSLVHDPDRTDDTNYNDIYPEPP
jgi:hypothetical protein